MREKLLIYYRTFMAFYGVRITEANIQLSIFPWYDLSETEATTQSGNVMPKVLRTKGTVFSTFHFLRNLRIGSLS